MAFTSAMIEPTLLGLKDVSMWLTFDDANKERCYVSSFSRWRTRGVHIAFAMTLLGCVFTALRCILRGSIRAADGRPLAHIGLIESAP